jgi:hypothetical protein
MEEDIVGAVLRSDEAVGLFVIPLDDGATPAHGAGVCVRDAGEGNFVYPVD